MRTEKDDDKSVETDVEALSETALELYQEGRLRQARRVCEDILRIEQRPAAVLILAQVAHKQAKLGEAIEGYEQFLRMFPEHAASHFHLGLALDDLGRTRRAIRHYEESIRLDACNAAVHRRLGGAYGKFEHWGRAISAYKQAIAINPGDARPLRQLGVALQQLGRMHAAIGYFEQALELQPDYSEALVDFARTLLQLGRAEEAIAPLEQAIIVDPDNSVAQIGLAMALKQLGRTEDAVLALEQLLSLQPGCGEAHYQLSMIRPESGRIAGLEEIVSDPELSKHDASYCQFALGNLYQNDESWDQAFEHFQKANALKRSTLDYDADQNKKIIDKLIDVYSSEFFANKSHLGSESQLPVFIVGMPRSGTTLVEQIISSHPSVHGAGELEAIRGANLAIAERLLDKGPHPECMTHIDESLAAEHAQVYLEELSRHDPSAARITDKFPRNYAAIGLIRTLFPKARIVHCKRDALDNCVSLYCYCFPLMAGTFELTELAEFYLGYERLMAHWEELFGDDIFTVRYEDLVTNQEQVSRQLIEFVGLDWDESCLDFQNNERNVSTPSNMQVRKPMYTSSVNRWKHYEAHLHPLIDTLSANQGEETLAK